MYDGYDLEGNLLFNAASEVAFDYSIYTVIAEKNGKYAILDKTTEAADFAYDNIQFYNEKSVIATQKGKFFLNTTAMNCLKKATIMKCGELGEPWIIKGMSFPRT